MASDASPDSTFRSSRLAAVSLYRMRKKAARKEMSAAEVCTTSAPASAAFAAWSATETCVKSAGVVVPMSCASMAAKNVVYESALVADRPEDMTRDLQ